MHLDLSENVLKSIPSVSTALVDLATLDLQHNQLGPNVPNAVCSFSALTVLRLHDNKCVVDLTSPRSFILHSKG
jgi:Leucine-rich repeat (LRR) protein